MSADPANWMRRAVALSARGYPAPNPRVGCVIVRDGSVVGEGYHDHAGGPHAEVVALAQAGGLAQGATAYVTLEPCAHHGRTPPCTEALIRAGVAHVEAALRDPNPLGAGGSDVLGRAGITFRFGLLADEAREANVVWLTAMERRRPFVTVKAAVTLDGLMAKPDGSSKWITGEESRRAARRLRAEMGAVLVGRGTVQSDDPQLTARDPDVKNEPLRVLLDPAGRLSGSERVFQAPGETQWTVAEGRKSDPRQTEAPFNAGFDLGSILGALFAKGVTGLLIEGGPETIRRFADTGLVDRLTLFVGPVVFGSGRPFPFASFRTRDLVLLRAFESDGDALLSYSCVLTENNLK